jgi:hypothetical protein
MIDADEMLLATTEVQALAELPPGELSGLTTAAVQGLTQAITDLVADPAARDELLRRASRCALLWSGQLLRACDLIEAAHIAIAELRGG